MNPSVFLQRQSCILRFHFTKGHKRTTDSTAMPNTEIHFCIRKGVVNWYFQAILNQEIVWSVLCASFSEGSQPFKEQLKWNSAIYDLSVVSLIPLLPDQWTKTLNDRANDTRAFYKNVICHGGRTSQRSWGFIPPWKCSDHSGDKPFPGWLLLDVDKCHISGCIMSAGNAKISLLSSAAQRFPYLEVCPWNGVIRPLRASR